MLKPGTLVKASESFYECVRPTNSAQHGPDILIVKNTILEIIAEWNCLDGYYYAWIPTRNLFIAVRPASIREQ